jgi:hypothetical protein
VSEVPSQAATDLAGRLARLETSHRRTRVALLSAVLIAIAAVTILLLQLRQSRRNPSFDTVSARQFLVKDGDSTRAMLGMYDKPPGAVLLLGPDDRRVPGVNLGSHGEIVARGSDGKMFHVLGSSLSMFYRDMPMFTLELGEDGSPSMLARGPEDALHGVARLSGGLPRPLVFDTIGKVYPHAPSR